MLSLKEIEYLRIPTPPMSSGKKPSQADWWYAYMLTYSFPFNQKIKPFAPGPIQDVYFVSSFIGKFINED